MRANPLPSPPPEYRGRENARRGSNLIAILLIAITSCASFGADGIYNIGIAKQDITPDYPIRLCGYAARKKEVTSLWRLQAG